jgi:lactoylglutathione lyase
MALQTFSHVGICVRDLDRSTRFYVDVLGFAELFTMHFDDELAATMERDGGFTSRMLRRDDVRVELLAWDDGRVDGDGTRRAMDHLGFTHLCFRVDDATELFDLAERAGGAAHPATTTTMAGTGVTVVYLTDPDGVRIECMAGSPDLAQFPAPG